jgi:hypothetical protein
MLKKIVCCIVLTAFTWQITGCYNARRVSVRDTEAVQKAKEVIIETRDGKKFTLSQVRVEYPVLIGLADTGSGYIRHKTVKLDISDVNSVVVKNVNLEMTIVAGVAGVALVCAAVFAVIMLTKESCPLVYSRDGDKKALEGELYSGAIFRSMERKDFLKLNHLKPSAGRCTLDLSNEADETQYTDELILLAVDHPIGTDVLPDATGRIRTVSSPVPPVSAHDEKDADALNLIRRADGHVWNANPFNRNPEHDGDLQDGIVLRFNRPADAEQAKLVVRIGGTWWADYFLKDMMAMYGNTQESWNRSMDDDPQAGLRAERFMKRQGLSLNVSVMRNGQWEEAGYFYPTGPVAFQDELMVLPLDGVGDELVVRLSGGVLFWMVDYVAADFNEDTTVRVSEIIPDKAETSDGVNVVKLITASDDQYLSMPRIGDRVSVDYLVPPKSLGLDRSYVLRSEGYYTIHPPVGVLPDQAKLLEFRNDPYRFSRNALKQFWMQCGYRPES